MVSVYIDRPLVNQNKILQNISVINNSTDSTPVNLQVRLWNNRNKLLFETGSSVVIHSGKSVYEIEWKKSGFKLHPLYDLYKDYELFPIKDSIYYELVLQYPKDTLSYYQVVKEQQIEPEHAMIQAFLSSYEKEKSTKASLASYNKFTKAYFEKLGFTVQIEQTVKSRTLHISHKAGYIGTFEHPRKISTRDTKEIKAPLDDLTFTSLSEKEASRKTKEDREIQGELYTMTQLSTGREAHSSVDNNYYEVGGTVNLPVMGIPFTVNGMYTSQDKGRNFKSSFINFSFDKSKLAEELESYNSIYSENAEKVKDYKNNVNRNFSDNLSKADGIKNRIRSEVKNELSILIVKLADSVTSKGENSGIPYNQLVALYHNPESATRKKIEQLDCNGCDSTVRKRLVRIGKLLKDLQQYTETYNAVKSKYEQIQVKQLADSIQIDDFTGRYYDKEKGLTEQIPGVVEKLPNGKLKKWASRLTNFDAGMLSSYHSDYTLAGQMTKGLDLGYDVGPFQVGANAGFTDYLSPDGTVMKYRTGMGKITAEPFKDNQLQVSYFTYAPSGNQTDVASNTKGNDYGGILSATKNRTDIFSFLYAATYDRLAFKIDYSHSKKQQTDFNFSNLKNSSFNIGMEARYIPQNDIAVLYEHIGSDFENRVLPFLFSGTQKIKLQNTGTYFKNKIKLRLDYQLLTQTTTAYDGKNQKFGVELQTNFRNSPNVALAYKPFSTFRTLTDTFQIQQQPLMGDVFVLKSGYVLKTNDGSTYNFNIISNYNTSRMDTSSYSSSNSQVMVGYTGENIRIQGIAGYVNSNGVAYESTIGNQDMLFNNFFESLQVSGQLNKLLSLGGGLELAHHKAIFVRTGINASTTITPQKWPFRVSLMARWMNYNKEISPESPSVVACNLGVYYTFSNKKRK